MPPIKITSFWYAIYKKLWATASTINAHNSVATSFGGFSLMTTTNNATYPNGIFGTVAGLGAPLAAPGQPAANNPLYAILKATVPPLPQPPPMAPDFTVLVPPNNAPWPAMPWPASGPYKFWDAWGAPVIAAMKTWIETNNQIDDTPKGTWLDYGSYISQPPPAFPFTMQAGQPVDGLILFVASTLDDNGARPLPASTPFWKTSRIYVTGTDGSDQHYPDFKPGEEHYIAAVIGNVSAGVTAGALAGFPHNSARAFNIVCNAHVFSSFMSPGTPLPALSNLDPLDANAVYEQYRLAPTSREVVGFRFNVDSVYAALRTVMQNFNMPLFGGMKADEFLKASGAHACVKVLIQSGETKNIYNGMGSDTPVDNMPPSYPTPTSPLDNRKIAQRNLAAFDPAVTGMKKPHWKLFMMSQAFGGMNGLAVHADVPADAVGLYLAVPTVVYDRYVAKGGSHKGFETVTDVPRPFPEAVMLRQTAPGARLEIADHAHEFYFGMALGVAILRETRMSDIDVVHTAHDKSVVGEFTLRPQTARR